MTMNGQIFSPCDQGSMHSHRKRLPETILILAIKLRCLLMGEDIVLMRKFGDTAKRKPQSTITVGKNSICIPILNPQPHPLIPERNRRILEVTREIIKLLTGEVPIRCQDVSVCFSMEEWEHLQAHKDAMIEGHKFLSSFGFDNAIHKDQRPASQQFHKRMTNVSGKNQKTGRILDLISEMINILAAENYILVKMDGGLVADERSQEDLNKVQSPIMKPPSPFMTPERNIHTKILEVTKMIIELLTGEVSIRYQDVSVFFPTEEWEYIEQHKDLYKEVILDQQSFMPWAGASRFEGSFDECSTSASSPEDENASPSQADCTPVGAMSAGDIKEERPYLESTNLSMPFGKLEPTSNGREEVCGEASQLSQTDGKICNENLLNDDQYVTQDTSKVFKCSICSKSFPRLVDFLRHRRHHIMQHLTCSVCGKQFRNMRGLEDSKAQCGKPTCGNCHAGGSKEMKKVDGVRNAMKGQFRCTECEKYFATKVTLSIHMKVHTGQGILQCPECKKSFYCSSNLQLHMRVHTGERPFTCSECDKSFSSSSNLHDHYRIHTGEKPFACSECEKTFRYQSHLRAHQRLHTGQTLSCLECGKVFTYNSHLVAHQRVHTGEKPFSCGECGKQFLQKSHLHNHILVHTGEAPFKCKECGKGFAFLSAFTIHQESHTGKKAFKCSECEKNFTRRSSLFEHQKIHTGEKPYSCPECGKAFMTRRYMERHRLIHLT